MVNIEPSSESAFLRELKEIEEKRGGFFFFLSVCNSLRAAEAEVSILVSNTHVGWLTTPCNSSSGGSGTPRL